MKDPPPHLKVLEEIEQAGLPGLLEVLRSIYSRVLGCSGVRLSLGCSCRSLKNRAFRGASEAPPTWPRTPTTAAPLSRRCRVRQARDFAGPARRH